MIVLTNYRKTLRFLFTQYMNRCYKERTKEFDSMKNTLGLLSVGDFRKMLNDHDLGTIVSNEELNTLFRLINSLHKKSDLQTLTFDAFVYAFMQLAIHLHNKYKRSESCIPLVDSVITLLKHFENAARKRGQLITIYTNPEAASLARADQELVKELNAIIKKAPNYPLPEGFKKVQYNSVSYTYALTQKFPLEAEGLKIAIEIVDEILERALGIHFIESRIVFEQRIKIVPDQMKIQSEIFSVASHNPESVNSSRYKNTKLDELKKSKTGSLAVIRTRMSINTRLLIATIPKEMQGIVLEVKEVVNEVIKAVEEGRSYIIPTGEVINLAKKQKQAKLEDLAKSEREREEKRKKRHLELKKKLEESKKAETETINNANTQNKAEKAKKKSKEGTEELTKRLNEKAEKKKEEKLKLLEEAKTKEKEERIRRQRETKVFIAVQKEELEKKFRTEEGKKQKEQHEEKKRLKTLKEQYEKIHKEVENLLKADKETAELIKQQNKNLLKVFSHPHLVHGRT